MKVLLFCGSPHPQGTTAYALSLVAEELEGLGIETTTYQVGNAPVRGCIACGRCKQTHRCIFNDDGVNEFGDVLAASDALVLGAPTYYFGAAGQAHAFLDRVFYSHAREDRIYKPAAVVAVARRAGTITTVDNLLKFPMISEMPVVSSCYVPVLFGNNAQEAALDEEGVCIMRTLGRNMAWLLECIEAGRKAGVALPERLPAARTNFIRSV